MATNYPSAKDTGSTLPTPSAVNNTNSPSHAGLHGNTNDAIIAVQNKLGTGASTPTANTFLFGTGVGTSAYTQITSAQLLAAMTDETGTGVNVFNNTPTLITPKVDTINESTLNNGVTVGGVNLKSGVLTGSLANNTVTTASIATNAVTGAKIASYSTVRQDDTTNSNETAARILTGWGVITPGVASSGSETVTFNSAFASRPIITITSGGDNAAATTYGSGAINIKDAVIFTAGSITISNFVASFKVRDGSNYAAGNTVFYQWTAIGA